MGEFDKKSLRAISFSGYKNLLDCKLILNQTTVIVGSNNSGKSNFLEMFKLLSDLHFGGQEGRERVRGQLNPSTPTEFVLSGQIETEKSVYDVSYKLNVELRIEASSPKFAINSESFDFKQKSTPGKPKQFFHRKEKKLFWKSSSSENFKEHDISIEDPAFTVIKGSLESGLLDEELAICMSLYMEFLDYFKTPVFSVHKLGADYDKEIDQALKFIFPLQEEKSENFKKFRSAYLDILGLTEIRIVDVSALLGETKAMEERVFYCFVFEKNKPNPTYIGSLSDGSKILLLMLYNIFIKKNPLICIEEPEIGLHPNALNKILKIFISGDTESQALITTHSAYLLNLLDPKSIFLMESNEKGMSTLTPVTSIQNLEAKLRGKYVNFGDLFAENFKFQKDYALPE